MALDDEMRLIAHLLDDIDQIPRLAHAAYRQYPPAVLIEHSQRAAASCTYDHMVAEADRRWHGRKGIVPLDIGGLKVWLIENKGVLRLKKMDEDGRSRNYPTKQALNYDQGKPLPGLPAPAIRFTAGYLLDNTQTQFIRTQIAKPRGKTVEWCVALVPATAPGAATTWEDVTRQGSL